MKKVHWNIALGTLAWLLAILGILFLLNIGRIEPINNTQMISKGAICDSVDCAQEKPVALPWFSHIEFNATPTQTYLSFVFDALNDEQEAQALYFPKLSDNIAIELNGTLIRGSTRPRRMWNAPLLVPVNNAFLLNGENRLRVTLSGRLSEGLDLQPFYFGPTVVLSPYAEIRSFFGQEMARLGMVLMGAFGVGLVALWVVQRREKTFLWLGMSCFFASFFLAHYGLQTSLFSYKISSIAWVIAVALYVHMILLFVSSLLSMQFPRLVRTSILTLSLVAIAALLVPEDFAFHVSFLAALSCAAIAYIIIYVIWQHRRSIKTIDFVVFFACLSVALVLGWYGLVLHLHPTPPRTMHLFHFMPSVMALSCLWLILARSMQLIRAQDQLMAEQSQIIEEKTRELQVSFSRLAEVEKQQAVAQERGRIMADLHDGIGGHLVSTLSYLRDKNYADATLTSALEDALRELALLVDSVGNEDDVVTLLGMLRTRLEGLLAQKGLTFDWRIKDDPDVTQLGAAANLQIARIVQEAITNTIKHANATTVQVYADRTSIVVSDNGDGFDVNAPSAVGFGLRSMRQRATQIGAGFGVSSGSKGTIVTLSLSPT